MDYIAVAYFTLRHRARSLMGYRHTPNTFRTLLKISAIWDFFAHCAAPLTTLSDLLGAGVVGFSLIQSDDSQFLSSQILSRLLSDRFCIPIALRYDILRGAKSANVSTDGNYSDRS